MINNHIPSNIMSYSDTSIIYKSNYKPKIINYTTKYPIYNIRIRSERVPNSGDMWLPRKNKMT